jgi:putative transposase
MKKRYTEAQIAFALRQAASGTPVSEITRKMGVTDVTFYRWKKVYANMDVTEIRRLKQLEDENHRLKRLVADLTLDKQMLQEVLSKKL